MARKKDTNPHKHSNPQYAWEMHGLRSSNAAGVHGDRRTKRLRDRSARKRAALRDQMA